MRKCKKYQEDLAAYLYNELSQEDSARLESHLNTCALCCEELAAARQVLTAADTLSEDIENAVAAVDWEQLPVDIADRVIATAADKEQMPTPVRKRPFIFQPRLQPVLAALLVGIVLGAVVTLTLFRTPASRQVADIGLNVSQGMLENMDIEMARQDTLDYLEKSSYLLLDFVQSSPDKAAGFWQSDFAARRADDLLSKKKYINLQLDNYQMAKAKAICDQIEFLFIELTRISSRLSPEELEDIRAFIEERQLLLKINLIKKELQQSEV